MHVSYLSLVETVIYLSDVAEGEVLALNRYGPQIGGMIH